MMYARRFAIIGAGLMITALTTDGARAETLPFDYCATPQAVVAAPGFTCSAPPPSVVCVNPSDVSDFYQKLNNPPAGVSIIYLPPGTYTLDSGNAAAIASGSGGAVAIPAGISVVGANTYADDANGVHLSVAGNAAIIDGSTAAFSPGLFTYQGCQGPLPAVDGVPTVTIGHRSCLANVTVKESAGMGIVLGGGNPSAGLTGWEASLSDSVATGNAVGPYAIGAGNFGCPTSGFNSGFTILRNIATGNNPTLDYGIAPTEELWIANSFLGTPGRIRARIERNRFYGDDRTAGIAAAGGYGGTTGSTVMIRSVGNVIDGTRQAFLLWGGLTGYTPLQSNNNSLLFVSSRDQILNTVTSPTPGGVVLIGAGIRTFYPQYSWIGPISQDNLIRSFVYGATLRNNRRDNNVATDFSVNGGFGMGDSRVQGVTSQPFLTSGLRNRSELAILGDFTSTELDLAPSGLKVLPWAANQSYSVGTPVTNQGNHYECRTAGISGSGPTGTLSDIVDGTVHWRYYAASAGIQESAIAPPSSKPDTNRAVLLSMMTPLYLVASVAPGGSDTGTQLDDDAPGGATIDADESCVDLSPSAASNSDPLICRDAKGIATGLADVRTTLPPFTLNCPAPPPVECTSPNGAAVSFAPSANLGTDGRGDGFMLACSATSGNFALGARPVSCSLGIGDPTGDCAFNVVVQDTTPPALSIAASPAVLWPPDHSLVPITISPTVSDACDPSPVLNCSYVSNEPDTGCGSGDKAADVQVVNGVLELRAERCGNDPTNTSGRIYTITCTATDRSGNVSAPATALVEVPHDQSCHFHDDGTFVCH
jgi:hypothetical protein